MLQNQAALTMTVGAALGDAVEGELLGELDGEEIEGWVEGEPEGDLEGNEVDGDKLGEFDGVVDGDVVMIVTLDTLTSSGRFSKVLMKLSASAASSAAEESRTPTST